jgi:hypothetical protein
LVSRGFPLACVALLLASLRLRLVSFGLRFGTLWFLLASLLAPFGLPLVPFGPLFMSADVPLAFRWFPSASCWLRFYSLWYLFGFVVVACCLWFLWRLFGFGLVPFGFSSAFVLLPFGFTRPPFG